MQATHSACTAQQIAVMGSLLKIIKVNNIHDLSTTGDPHNACRSICLQLVQQCMCEIEWPKVVGAHCDLPLQQLKSQCAAWSSAAIQHYK